MGYEGEGVAKSKVVEEFEGESSVSFDNALRAAVHASGVEEGTKLVITKLEVVTIGDPNIGSYKVTVKPHG